MIKVNKYPQLLLEHFDPDGKSLGLLNEHESTDLRCQIAENKAEGYWLLFSGHRVDIQTNGMINDWKSGMYDTTELLLSRLFKAQRK